MFYFNNTRKPDFRNIHKIDYDEYWKHRGFVINKKLKEREEIILSNIPKGSSVLDIGCGNSLLPVKLKEKGVNINVADISEDVLTGFSKYGIKSAKIDLLKPELINISSYDYIILSEVLEHLSNPEDVLGVLKKYSQNFIITIPNSAFYRYRLHLMFSGRFFTQWVYHPSEHLRFWSHTDFLDWLSALGLQVEKTKASNGFTLFGLIKNLKNWWPNLFGHQIVYFCKVGK